ncbi:MAG: hypothetical protein ACR2LK_12125 [Solirubrobacteraceae bacterium]
MSAWDDARLSLLLELFGHGRTIGVTHAVRALAPLDLEDLLRGGLVEMDGGGVRSCIRLTSFEGLLLAGDPLRDDGNADYVQPIMLASTWTAHLTVRQRITSALDLGTGSGVQALLATRHAEHVVGADISAHALSCARLSQRLSGVTDRVTGPPEIGWRRRTVSASTSWWPIRRSSSRPTRPSYIATARLPVTNSPGLSCATAPVR